MRETSLNKQEKESHFKKERKSTRLEYLPSVLSLQRPIVLPFLLLSLEYGLVLPGYGFFLFVIGTDFADGYFAKRLNVSTKFGAHLDVAADFVFIFTMLLYFVAKGFYSPWILLLVAFAFAQFILTSLFSKIVYDPVGKYYGSLLYGAIGLTWLFTGQLIHNIVTVGIIVATAVLFASRLLFLRILHANKAR